MPGATPIYALPYPIGSDRLDAAVTTIPQSLATQLESTLQGWGGIAAPGAWIAMPAMAAGWANTGGVFHVAQYRKIGNAVYLRGTITRAGTNYVAGAVISTLPVGFRPLATTIWAADNGNGGTHLQLSVNAAGQVICGNAVNIGGILSFTSPPIFVD